jgi:hypothetical protein
MSSPKLGDHVFYVLAPHDGDGRNANQARPAIITRIWDSTSLPTSCVQLQVFTDGQNDGLANVEWRTSIHQSSVDAPMPGQFYYQD